MMDFQNGSRKDHIQEITIGYLAPILFPITEYSTVQDCLAISMLAAKKLNQTCTFVTLDLAVAKIAFDTKFGDAERFFTSDYSPWCFPYNVLVYGSFGKNDDR